MLAVKHCACHRGMNTLKAAEHWPQWILKIFKSPIFVQMTDMQICTAEKFMQMKHLEAT